MSLSRRLFDLTLYFLDKTEYVVPAAVGSTLLYTRSLHVFYVCVGSLVANFSAKGLKRALRQSRPVSTTSTTSTNINALPNPPPSHLSHLDRKAKAQIRIERQKTYGMPSTHSTSVMFFMSYILLALNGTDVGRQWIGALKVGTAFWACGIVWSRIYLGYHTWPQVIVGSLLGNAIGLVWKLLWGTSLVQAGADSLTSILHHLKIV